MDPTQYISLSEATKLLPNHPHIATVWRWARKGVKSRNGNRIKLRCIRLGGRIFTTHAWLDAFGRYVSEDDQNYFDTRLKPPKQKRQLDRRRRHDQAAAETTLNKARVN